MSSAVTASASETVREGIAKVGDIELAYETHGAAGNPAVLLIMGFNMTLLAWPEAFIQALVRRGLFVVTFDNRDAGKSSRVASTNLSPLPMLTLARMSGIRLKTPYTLDDMADDAAGLLDHLGIESAQVIGVSMGGMIAQLLALNHPDRVHSLGLMMTHPGAVTYSIPSPKLGSLLLQQPGNDERTQLAYNLKFWNMVCGASYAPDEAEIRRLTQTISQRSNEPHGRYRQMAAIIAAPDRSARLKTLNVPTAVLHGTDDPLIIPRGGKTLTRLIPGARLKLIEGMGHILPPALCESMVAFLTNDDSLETSSAA